MFTIRFERGNTHRVITAEWYQVTTMDDGRQHVQYVTNGAENHSYVGEDNDGDREPVWHDVYVMNSTGKTIERIHQ